MNVTSITSVSGQSTINDKTLNYNVNRTAITATVNDNEQGYFNITKNLESGRFSITGDNICNPSTLQNDLIAWIAANEADLLSKLTN